MTGSVFNVDTSGNVTIIGGTIDGVDIGLTTQGAARFNNVHLTNLTASLTMQNDAFTTAGVVHNSSSGFFTSSLIANSDVAPMSNNTFKGNISGGSASPSDLTVSQMQAALGITGGEPVLTHASIGYGSTGNELVGDSNLTWDATNQLLYVGAVGTSTGGVVLPTLGGTAGVLDFYQPNFIQTNTFTGPWGSTTYSNDLRFERIGNNVTMSWPGFFGEVASMSQVMQSVLPIPPQFSSTNVNFINSVFPIQIYSGTSNSSKVTGQLALLNSGSDTYIVFSNADGSALNTTYAGIPRGQISWTVLP